MGGGRRRPGMSKRGEDVQTVLNLSFMEAVRGCSKEVNVAVADTCETCDGTGSKDGSKPSTCPSCNGTGEMTMRNGFLEVRTTCRKCGGTGQVVTNPCGTCSGAGVTRRRKTVEVTVPPGVDTGITMRLAGQGDKGEHGGSVGHLYVQIKVEQDPFFERDGADIHVHVPLTVAQAILGDTVTIPTVTGEVDLRIPPGSQPNDKLAMRHRGIKRLNAGGRGSQYVHLRVEIPKELSERQRELMEEFRKEEERLQEKNAAGGSKMKSRAQKFLDEALRRIRGAMGSEEQSGGRKKKAHA